MNLVPAAVEALSAQPMDTDNSLYSINFAAGGGASARFAGYPRVLPAATDFRIETFNVNAGPFMLRSVQDGTNLRAGLVVDAITGLMDLPIEDDVRSQVRFDMNARMGNLVVPAPSDVRRGVPVGDTVGTAWYAAYPDPADTRSGTAYA